MTAQVFPLEIEGVDPDHLNRLVQWAQPVQQNHIDQRAAREAAAHAAAEQEDNMNSGTVVVSLLMVLVGTVVTVISVAGSGTPNSGKAFVNSSAQLRNDVAGYLSGARPASACWSGSAAAHYDGKIGEHQDYLEAIAAADLQAADAVATQAHQVEQSRQQLEIILAALLASITVAVVMQVQWQTAKAAGSPAAPAYEAALIAFGVAVITAVITAAVMALLAMDDAGQSTKTALDNVRGAYQQVVGGVTAAVPAEASRAGR